MELQSMESSIVFDPKPLEPEGSSKRWYDYLPLCGTVILLLAPHPSLLYVLVDFHLQTLHQPFTFLVHLMVTYTLSFLAFSSLIVCLAWHPGPANAPSRAESGGDGGDEEEMSLRDALMPDEDFSSPGKWCRKCWAPKAERTHHCAICNMCVLKMDHHCPWIGARCIGHRTYPAFVHFLCSITLLALYITAMASHGLWYAFSHPFVVNELTPVHEIGLAFAGAIFSLLIGSFAGYHIYLISINATTLEFMTPFMLLRHLPRLPRTGHSLSDPALEPELTYAQRRLVRDAHSQVSLYDVGWKKNFAQVFGWNKKYGWMHRLWYGGACMGDGKTFPRNPRAEEVLAKLAQELVKADADR
ncbi:zf-DHHC-domain-containing protein [Agrocybe pediades]|nr:zf-DHHC-domain-containing protein [Agrocybe pediades]